MAETWVALGGAVIVVGDTIVTRAEWETVEMLVITTVAAAILSLMNIVKDSRVITEVEVAKTVETVFVIILTKMDRFWSCFWVVKLVSCVDTFKYISIIHLLILKY
jgi:hypothetical protein